MNNTTGTITGVKKLIILDYRNGTVVVLPVKEDVKYQVSEWCHNNNTFVVDCKWMVWDGYVRYGE